MQLLPGLPRSQKATVLAVDECGPSQGFRGKCMVVFQGHLKQIGVIHSPYREQKDAPSQGRHADAESTLEVFREYESALLDIERCSHLIVLYWQDKANRSTLQTRTPWGSGIHGVFATRSPNRPNPIGFCTVELLERNGLFLKVRGMDAIDCSPLIDIKPYFPQIDSAHHA